jgi:TrmH family RNA methyltransferase
MSRGSLTDPRSPQVRRLRALSRRSTRNQERRFLVEGAHAVEEALAAATHEAAPSVVVRELFMTTAAAQRHEELISVAHENGVAVSDVTDVVAAALSETVTPQGVIAVVDFLDVSVGTLLDFDPQLVAVLANVRDPGNAGSVIRAADAAGCNGVVFTGDSVDPYNGKAVRAAIGGHFHLPLAIDIRIGGVVDEIRAAGLQILAADAMGTVDLDTAGREGLLKKPTAWLFGNEAWGMPDDLTALADRVIRIPIYGRAESLNLAMSAALVLYASASAQRLS